VIYAIVLVNIIVHGGYMGGRVVVSLAALDLHAGPFEVGVLVAMFSAFSVLLALYSGKISDRIGVRTPMLVGTLGMLGALLVPWWVPGMPGLYASASLQGAGFILFNVSVQNLTGALGTLQDRTRNFSLLSLGYSISSLVGPMACGFSIDHAGYARTFLFLGCSMILPALIIVASPGMRTEAAPRQAAGTGGTMELVRNRGLRTMFIVSGLVVTGWDLFTFYLPIYGHSLGLSASAIGLLLGCFAAATLVTRFALPRLVAKVSGEKVLGNAMLLGACVFLVFPFVHTLVLLYAACFALGLALGCGQPLCMMLTFNRAPPGRSGEVTGLRLTVNHFTHFLVPLAAGAAGAAFGLVPVFWANAVFLATSGYLARHG
jgi:MFS family permease